MSDCKHCGEATDDDTEEYCLDCDCNDIPRLCGRIASLEADANELNERNARLVGVIQHLRTTIECHQCTGWGCTAFEKMDKCLCNYCTAITTADAVLEIMKDV